MPTVRRSRVSDVIAIILLVAASVSFVGVKVAEHTTVSPIDEYVYIDYVAKIPTQGVVRQHEETGVFARDYLSCHGLRFLGAYPDSLCQLDGKAPDADYPYGGITTADIYTPLYFGVAWLTAQAAAPFGIDLVTGARLSGAIWLAAAAIVLFIALRRMRAPTPLAFGVSLWIAVSPIVEFSNTYISTDATALLAGSTMLLLLTLPVRRLGVRLAVFGAFAALFTLLKVQNVSAVGFVALFLLAAGIVRAVRRHRRDGSGSVIGLAVRDRDVLTAIVTVACAVVAQAAWIAVRSSLSLGASPDQGVGAPLTARGLVAESLRFVFSLQANPLPMPGDAIPAILGRVGSVLAAVGIIGVLLAARARTKPAIFGGSALVVILVLGPMLAVLTVVTAGYYFVLPPRYGMALIPIAFAALCLLIARKRWPGWAMTAMGTAVFGYGILVPAVN